MTEPQLQVSIIIPVFNGAAYLAQAIDSALVQSYPHTEVIVIDDASTDGSAAIASQYSQAVTYHRNETQSGIAASRNKGIENSSGAFIAFLDADDYWEADKLKLQVQTMTQDPTLDIVLGHVQQFISPELEPALQAKLICPPEPMPGYLPGAMLVRRASLERVGLFDANWRSGEFIDWYARAQEHKLRMTMLPDVVLHRRLHNTNQGVIRRDTRIDYVRILKASLDRKRQQQHHENQNRNK